MKKALVTLIVTVLLFFNFIKAQNTSPFPDRQDFNIAAAPFLHGVASGDPMSDKVIIWTRVTDASLSSINVDYLVATDTGMVNIVSQGTVTTNASKDFTVKVDVTNLQANTTYYYEFSALGNRSVRGRTKTLPTGNINAARFAFVSCAHYENGFFNAYEVIKNRNDIDFVVHLGDYIYEYETGGLGNTVGNRIFSPDYEIKTLDDYRMRHNFYKMDRQLQLVHQQYPFFIVWDDHEFANDAWMGGAANHTEGTEGLWADRKMYAQQAWHEWIPSRDVDVTDPLKIYRTYNFGSLFDLIMTDTRIYGREEQVGVTSSTANDANRTIYGTAQRNWLYNELNNSSAKWRIIGNQIMMGPLKLLGLPVNNDSWDNYTAERTNTWNVMRNKGNCVILTGDFHTAWANDLPASGYSSSSGANSAGVEFVTTSVTTTNFDLPAVEGVATFSNPHIKWCKFTGHGYCIVDIDNSRVNCDYYEMQTIESQSVGQVLRTSWQVRDGENHLIQGVQTSRSNNPIQAPLNPRTNSVGIENINENIAILGVYPNPTNDYFHYNFNINNTDKISVQIVNNEGKVCYKEQLGKLNEGVHIGVIDIRTLSNGLYKLIINGKNGAVQKSIIKQ
jgi:alkaline phosphatase D